jgi:hypothetical protein
MSTAQLWYRFVAYQFLTWMGVSEFPRRRPGRGPRWEELDVDFDRWRLLSPYHTLGKVESWIFDLDKTDGSVWPAIALLVFVTIAGTLFVRHRLIARLSV